METRQGIMKISRGKLRQRAAILLPSFPSAFGGREFIRPMGNNNPWIPVRQGPTGTAGAAIRIMALCVLLASSFILGADLRTARANGAPIKIILSYLPDVSNWGPTSATGIAEVVMKEGEVNLSVVGLPPLENESYFGWLVNTSSGEAIGLGGFNADRSQVAKVAVTLPSEIPPTGWNLLLVTVDAQGQDHQVPGAKKSIGGYFPDAAEAKRAPAQLPRTGGDTGSGAEDGPTGTYARRAVLTIELARTGLPDGGNVLAFAIVALAALGVGLFAGTRMRSR